MLVNTALGTSIRQRHDASLDLPVINEGTITIGAGRHVMWRVRRLVACGAVKAR